jgi:hypothetical protein
MYWPSSMPQAKPNFSPPPTTAPNYGENQAFGNSMMTSNNVTNENHMIGKYIFSLHYVKTCYFVFNLKFHYVFLRVQFGVTLIHSTVICNMYYRFSKS